MQLTAEVHAVFYESRVFQSPEEDKGFATIVCNYHPSADNVRFQSPEEDKGFATRAPRRKHEFAVLLFQSPEEDKGFATAWWREGEAEFLNEVSIP